MDKKFKYYFLGLAAALLYIVSAPGFSYAQETAAENSADEIRASKSVDELPPEPEETSQPAAPKTPPVVKQNIKELKVPEGKEVMLDVYTVKKGDYLRKLARKEYGDHELWEVIYGYNKYIKDPHWIFPGDKIIFPRIVDKLPEVPEAEVSEGKPEEEKEEPVEEVDGRDYEDFLAPEDFMFDATVTGFKDANLLQAQGDYLFIDIGKNDGLKENKRLYIYRKRRRISHPYTGALLGQVVEKIGVVQVTADIETKTATARIIYSDFDVKKGDMLLLAK